MPRDARGASAFRAGESCLLPQSFISAAETGFLWQIISDLVANAKLFGCRTQQISHPFTLLLRKVFLLFPVGFRS